MKKKEMSNKFFLVVVLAIVLITLLVVSISNFIPNSEGITGWAGKGSSRIITTCVDSDGGVNLYEYGSVSGTRGSRDYNFSDYCVGSSLYEGYCAGTKSAIRSSYCENGCVDGVCKEPYSGNFPLETDIIYGDLNFDKEVNYLDAEILRNHISGKMNLGDLQKLSSDFDSNGILDINDLYQLNEFTLGRIDSLNVIPRIYGDLNFDKKVDSIDYDLLYKNKVGVLDFTIFQKMSADVNLDNVIDNKDLEVIGDYLDGRLYSLPLLGETSDISASLVYNAHYPGDFKKTGADSPPGWGCPAVPNSPFSPVTLAFDGDNRMYVGNDGYYGDSEQRLLKQLYVFDNFKQNQNPNYYVRVPLGSAGDLSFDDRGNFVIQDHTYPKVIVIDPFEKDERGKFKWLYPTNIMNRNSEDLDFNKDGYLDNHDVSILVQVALESSNCPKGFNCDLDCDGLVGASDLNRLSGFISEGYDIRECVDESFEPLTNLNVGCAEGEYSFYGKCIDTLKLFGQTSIKEISQDQIAPNSIYHSPGNAIDKTISPNKLYVVDSGNNRILAFSSLGYCTEDNSKECTNDLDCVGRGICDLEENKTPDLVIGQESFYTGSCNGDNNLGTFANPSEKTLCLSDVPRGTNVAEQALRMNIDTDLEGNLYIMDVYNNRVLRYNSPLSNDKSNGRGDNVADLVIGQEDFYSNGINSGRGPNNRDRNTLYLSEASRSWSIGLSVDNLGNVWVADSFNSRVLRFPKNSKFADLVIGQKDFKTISRNCNPPRSQADYNTWDNNLPLDTFCKPTFAKINPETGDLYVIDDHDIFSRILVFNPDFKNGMSAYKVIKPEYPGKLNPPLEGYPNYYFSASSISFNCNNLGCDSNFFEGGYSDGKVWISEVWPGFRILLLNENDEIIETIGARDENEWGRGYGYDPYHVCGDLVSNKGLSDPSGSFGFDEQNNLYVSDERMGGVSRFSLPYENVRKLDLEGDEFVCLPGSDFTLLGPNKISGSKFRESLGTITYMDQLIVQDWDRLLVWNNYYDKEHGEQADFVLGQENMETRTERTFDIGDASFFAIDDYDRLWMTNGLGNRITIFQLPLTKDSIPLVQNAELYWDDDKTPVGTTRSEISGKWSRISGIDFDETTKTMWIANTNRILRIRNYDDPIAGYLYVDKVIGQVDKTNECNRGQDNPSANALCNAFQIKFDNYGNLFVIENDYECHINARITMFSAQDIGRLKSLNFNN